MSVPILTVKVSNISSGATERDIKEFFSFSGEIVHIEMHGDNEHSQVAYVTFKYIQGAETAVLLSGATIVGQPVTISPAPEYTLPAVAQESAPENKTGDRPGVPAHKAEDVVSTMLAKGFIVGKDAVNRAKSFDEKHKLISSASARVNSLDQKIGLTEKINVGTTIVNDKVKDLDKKYHVSEKTKTALAAAEQRVSTAGSAIMKNRYILTGASWVTGAYHRVAKAAEDVGQKTKEKVLADDNQERRDQGYGQVQSGSPKSPKSEQPSKPQPAQGLIL